MASSPNVDYSQPIAALLKSGTAAAHEEAEHSEGAGWLTRGELDKDEYIRFLMMLYHVYDTLEQGLEKHATHPVLAPTYNPTLFARSQRLAADISFLLQTPEASWQAHPLHTELVSQPPARFTAYTSRLQKLADSDPAALLAHAYVRYLGDLSGGQFIKRRIAKAYGLDDTAGVAFYDFKQLHSNASSTIGDMKKIKEWYRDGMNAGVGDDVALKAKILDEASVAFQLNTGLFSTLKPPSRPRTPETPNELVHPTALGDPMTPTEVSAPYPSKEGKVVAQGPETTERTFPLSSVLALFLAIAISQFVLVLSGANSQLTRWIYKFFA